MPLTADCSFAPIEAIQQYGRKVDDPAMDCRMVDADAALSHHLLQIPQAQTIGQIPANAQQDHRSVEMSAFEHAAIFIKRRCPHASRPLPKSLQQNHFERYDPDRLPGRSSRRRNLIKRFLVVKIYNCPTTVWCCSPCLNVFRSGRPKL